MAYIHELQSQRAGEERAARRAWARHLLDCPECRRSRITCPSGQALRGVLDQTRFALQLARQSLDPYEEAAA